MPAQLNLALDPGRGPFGRPGALGLGGDAAPVFLVTGSRGPGSEAADRLLERALADSGLAGHDPVELAAGAGLPHAYWNGRNQPPGLVVAFGAEAASELLRRPVSLPLERGRVRQLADGGRILVTEHPKAILRLADAVARGREYRRLVNDLLMAVPHRLLAA